MNPYWDAVQHAVTPGEFRWEGPTVARFKFDWVEGDPPILDRDDYVHRYSWTITDPSSVGFVIQAAKGGLVDPMAGTGYWAYVLAHMNVDTMCYDLHAVEENHWHKGMEQWVDVEQLDAVLAVAKHPNRTLMLAWPPYSDDIGAQTLNAYRGDRVIYIGEGHGGCTGNDLLHELLEEEWNELAEHTPVQWWGLHDRITVYERKTRDQMVDFVSEVRDREKLRTRTKRLADVP